jgi:hypothetical protein
MSYISYSGFKQLEECGYAYWHRYVNKTRSPTPDNCINALYGSTVGLLFEAFYRDRLYRRKDYEQHLINLCRPTLDAAIKEQLRRGDKVLDWHDDKANYHSYETLLADIETSIPRGLDVIRVHKLVGPRMEAELKLDTRYGQHTVGGRADFVIKRVPPFNDLLILDGKGSRHRDKYIDGDRRKEGQPIKGIQLKWYSFLYREHFGHVPDKIGYLFWRYPSDQAMEWVTFTPSDLDKLKSSVLSTLDRIDKNVAAIAKVSSPQTKDELRQEFFPAQAGFHCNLCSYLSVCEKGKSKVKQMKRSTLLPEGVSEFSLGLDDETA